MIKDGKVLLQGTHREILKDMEGKVYSLDTNDENLVSEIQNKYKSSKYKSRNRKYKYKIYK